MKLNDWRSAAGRVAATFSTPLSEILAMPWDELTLWWAEAKAIDRERWEPLRRALGR